jgi:hypothetical protein
LLAHAVTDGKVTTVGLRLADPDEGRPVTVFRFVTTLAKSLAKSSAKLLAKLLGRRGRWYGLDRS